MTPVPLNKRVGGIHSPPGSSGKERKSLARSWIRTRVVQTVSLSLHLTMMMMMMIIIIIITIIIINVKFTPRTGHEGSEKTWRHSSPLSLTLALDGCMS
jgi:hypothetical protein